MLRKLLKGLLLILIVVFVSACSVPKVSTRFYAEDKPRVDQVIDGNAGYLMGEPPEPVPSPEKKTRKVYILEFSKELGEPPPDEELYGMDLSDEIERSNYELPPRREIKSVPTTPKISLPSFDEIEAVEMEQKRDTFQGTFTEYKVEKNDTLQKISKKFYNSYSKWHMIYEANKSLIKDPNFIKPGIVIKIPDIQ